MNREKLKQDLMVGLVRDQYFKRDLSEEQALKLLEIDARLHLFISRDVMSIMKVLDKHAEWEK